MEPVEFVPIPYHNFTSFSYFLQQNFGLLHLTPREQVTTGTQTEPPTKEQSSQTEKKTGILWGYFSS